MKENRLDELKREYESIPVPEGLEFRVRASIAQAKQEQKKEQNKHMKKHTFWQSAGVTAAAAMLTIVVLANSSASIAHAMERVPVLGAITKVVTFRTYEDERGSTSAHVDVPQVEGGSQELNDAIAQYTDTIIAQYQEDAALVEQYAQDPNAPDAESNHYELDLTYTVVTDNDSVFALRFNKSLIMASGSQEVKIYNVDKATGRILTLSDLFKSGSNYLDVLTKNIQEQMQAQMDADDSLYYWLHDEVSDWNFTALSPDATFYVNEGGQLVIVFNEGDVAPMYMGVCEFTIPSDIVAGIALPEYLK